MKIAQAFTLAFIRFYQRHLNFSGPFFKTFFLTDSACRFTPTCSEYAYQAVQKYGLLKGGFLALKRILRCHPWSKPGPDPLS